MADQEQIRATEALKKAARGSIGRKGTVQRLAWVLYNTSEPLPSLTGGWAEDDPGGVVRRAVRAGRVRWLLKRAAAEESWLLARATEGEVS